MEEYRLRLILEVNPWPKCPYTLFIHSHHSSPFICTKLVILYFFFILWGGNWLSFRGSEFEKGLSRSPGDIEIPKLNSRFQFALLLLLSLSLSVNPETRGRRRETESNYASQPPASTLPDEFHFRLSSFHYQCWTLHFLPLRPRVSLLLLYLCDTRDSRINLPI